MGKNAALVIVTFYPALESQRVRGGTKTNKSEPSVLRASVLASSRLSVYLVLTVLLPWTFLIKATRCNVKKKKASSAPSWVKNIGLL